MNRKHQFAILLGSLALCVPQARAQTRIEHRVGSDVWARLRLPRIDRNGRLQPRIDVPVLIELRDAADLTHLQRLTHEGVAITTHEGRVVRWRNYVSATVTRDGAERLDKDPRVVHVWNAESNARPPLAPSSELLRVDAARASASLRTQLTGEGITIADLDAGVNLFHPALFRGDAGWFDWIDADANGTFDPDTDAVDLNANGMIDVGETARVLRAEPVSENSGEPASGVRPEGFHPGYDWIYLDLNDNGQRDFRDDFTEETPAYGEPLFTPDDVNGNGVIDGNERLVRLGSSKIRSYVVRVQTNSGMFDRTYDRGTDLIEAQLDYTGGQYGYADAMHGSGVMGIMAADLPLPNRRWVGIAPDADYISVFDATRDKASSLMTALEYAPSVVLHEYVDWTLTPLDGSDAVSRLIDQSTADDHITHTCPAGNIGDSNKHRTFELDPGQTVSAPFNSPDQTYIALSLHYPAGSHLSISWQPSGGSSVDLTTNVSAIPAGNATLTSGISVTTRNFVEIDVMAYDVSPPYSAQITITNNGSSTVRVHGYVSDASGFSGGTTWSGADSAYTLSWPAAADNCIAVGAVAAYDDAQINQFTWSVGDDQAGDLRGFSSRGPRIDGELRPHVLAPDNPWSTMPFGPIFPSQWGVADYPDGAYALFGGTSGAGPHVAAAAALLAQKDVHGLDAREVLVSTSALHADPNNDQGNGLIDIGAAVGGVNGNSAPTVSLAVQGEDIHVGQTVNVIATVADADNDAMEIRWDDGYDGSFETEFAQVAAHPVVIDHAGTYRVKARVRDASGRVAEAALRFTARAATSADDDGDSGGGCDCRVGGARPSSNGRAWSTFVGFLAAAQILSLRRRRRAA